MKRKSIIAVAMVCAICASAVAASSAMAVPPHWYKCVEVPEGTGKYANNHCSAEGAPKKWSTVRLSNGVPTEVSSAAASNFTLSATLSGIKTKIVCSTIANSAGSIENTEAEGKGSGQVIAFSGCEVSEPAGKGCTVNQPITTNALKVATTMPTSTENKVTFTPESSEEYATVTLANCSVGALNGPKPVKGSAAGVGSESDASLLTFTSTSSSLTLAGQTATFTGSSRTSMKGTEETIALETP